MTISQMNKTIDTMKTLYPFDDSKTRIELGENLIRGSRDNVVLQAVDDETDTYITMERSVDRE